MYFKSFDATTLEFSCPRVLLEDRPLDKNVARIQELLQQKQQDAANALQAEGRRSLGVKQIRQTDPSTSPSRSRKERREVWDERRSKFKAMDGEEAEKAEEELYEFYKAYDKCLKAVQARDYTMVWPFGTWWMRVHLNFPTLKSGHPLE